MQFVNCVFGNERKVLFSYSANTLDFDANKATLKRIPSLDTIRFAEAAALSQTFSVAAVGIPGFYQC